MVRGIHNLTKSEIFAHIRKCNNLGATKLLCDSGGLYLRATATGAASWIFRFEKGGIGHEHGLGSFNTYDLNEAREKARRCRQLVAEGMDPIVEKRTAAAALRALQPAAAAPSKSFKFCLTKYIAFKEASWRSDKHRRDFESSVERYAFPVFNNGNQLVSTITMLDVLAVLEPHWIEHTETMRRVRARIEMVLDWAKGQGYHSSENPAIWRGNLDAHLNSSVRKETVHFSALPYHEIPALVTELRAAPDVAGDALLFAFLTACRSREVRFADWSEFDLVSGIWTIPASRMKAKEEHRVPLAESAIALLQAQPTFPRPGMPRTGFVFCDGRGVRELRESGMLDRLQKLRPGKKITTHGSTRSGFSTWAGEVAKARYEVREAALAHRNDPTVRAYLRTSHIDERRALMEEWAKFCFGGNVTPLWHAAA